MYDDESEARKPKPLPAPPSREKRIAAQLKEEAITPIASLRKIKTHLWKCPTCDYRIPDRVITHMKVTTCPRRRCGTLLKDYLPGGTHEEVQSVLCEEFPPISPEKVLESYAGPMLSRPSPMKGRMK